MPVPCILVAINPWTPLLLLLFATKQHIYVIQTVSFHILDRNWEISDKKHGSCLGCTIWWKCAIKGMNTFAGVGGEVQANWSTKYDISQQIDSSSQCTNDGCTRFTTLMGFRPSSASVIPSWRHSILMGFLSCRIEIVWRKFIFIFFTVISLRRFFLYRIIRWTACCLLLMSVSYQFDGFT